MASFTNETLTRHFLLVQDEKDAVWVDLNTLQEIDLRLINDDKASELIANYPDWAEGVIQPCEETFLLLGGGAFSGGALTLTLANGDTYIPVSVSLHGSQTPLGNPIYKYGFYEPMPLSQIGRLTSLRITGTTEVDYVGGQLPSYMEALLLEDIGIETFDINEVPGTLTNIDLSKDFLDSDALDYILTLIDERGATNGVLVVKGASMGTPDSELINNLQAKDWDVAHN